MVHPTRSAHDLLVAFDASGRSHPITVSLVPPRKHMSKTYLNSPERKTREKASRERCKKRQEALAQAERAGQGHGGRRRTYTKVDPLTLFGVRNGSSTGQPFSKLRTPTK